MTTIEQEVLGALQDLEAAATAVRGGGPKPDLRTILDRLRELTAALPPETEADLLHYMRRQSYEKARLHLLGRSSENAAGSCGH